MGPVVAIGLDMEVECVGCTVAVPKVDWLVAPDIGYIVV